MLKHSLLSEGVFNIGGGSGSAACLSLPQVLARLATGEDLAFVALRPHQRPAWHAFLVQLAYLALEADEELCVPTTPEIWVELLRALTPGHDDDAPWCLINSDWQRPAFLQAPCSAPHVADFKRTAQSAQDIDVLVTARHHDEKTGKLPLNESALDCLVFAMVSLQGGTAGLGAGNYNSMRMNGFYSSRPQFRLTFGVRGTGREFLRDLVALLDAREDIFSAAQELHIGTGISSPHRLLWLLIWDTGSLPLAHVHPLCLEVCRRVRLVQEGSQLLMRRATSDGMRVAAKEQRGHVLDPWVPIMAEEPPKALTAQPHTLGYRTLQGLLFDPTKARLPLLAKPSRRERSANEPGVLIAQVLVSGDGRTDGLLVRELLMPAAVLTRMVSAQALMAQRARQFVELASQAAGKAYRSALLQFVDGGAEVDWKNRDFTRAVDPWVGRYEQAVDEAFFNVLFNTIERDEDDTAAQRRWVHWLAAAAHQHLDLALNALPTRDRSRLFARSRAESLLRRSLRKQFGTLLDPASSAHQPNEEATHG